MFRNYDPAYGAYAMGVIAIVGIVLLGIPVVRDIWAEAQCLRVRWKIRRNHKKWLALRGQDVREALR